MKLKLKANGKIYEGQIVDYVNDDTYHIASFIYYDQKSDSWKTENLNSPYTGNSLFEIVES